MSTTQIALLRVIFTTKGAADYLRMNRNTLASKAANGTGPPFTIVHRTTIRVYDRDDLDAWDHANPKRRRYTRRAGRS